MSKVYYSITINSDHPKGARLEYRMGRDRHDLGMSRALQIEGENATTAQYMAEWVSGIHQEAVTYGMTPA